MTGLFHAFGATLATVLAIAATTALGRRSKLRRYGAIDCFPFGDGMRCAVTASDFVFLFDNNVEYLCIPRNALARAVLATGEDRTGPRAARKAAVVLEWDDAGDRGRWEFAFVGAQASARARRALETLARYRFAGGQGGEPGALADAARQNFIGGCPGTAAGRMPAAA